MFTSLIKTNRFPNKSNKKMTGAWLLANDLKQISDCTGGRKTQFDTASQNK